MWIGAQATSDGDVVGIFDLGDGRLEISQVNVDDDENGFRFLESDINLVIELLVRAANRPDTSTYRPDGTNPLLSGVIVSEGLQP